MILIVDSGSTKSDWVVVNGLEKTYLSTMGLNPFFHSEEIVVAAVENNSELFAIRNEVSEVCFYGAGCSSDSLKAIIQRGLQRVFVAAKITVDHDLTACAYATYEGEPAISCIIGTGSNSCYFDGISVSEEVPALGYILGDEGSGSYFGKKLIASYLYNKLPEHIHTSFYTETKLTKDAIVRRVYMETDANVFLASMMKFIIKHNEDPFIKKMIFEGFKDFVEIHVLCYANYTEIKTHFVGSIAHLFKTELAEACAFHGVNLGKTIQKPIDGLLDYHHQKLNV